MTRESTGSPARRQIERPIFIVSTPRSGSTLLFETLEQAPRLFTTGTESHGRIETISGLGPWRRDWSSNRLTAEDATPAVIDQLAENFAAGLVDRDGNPPSGRVRMLEKTPKNALRVPFFDAVWPDAIFVYLYRDPRQTLASMIEAWRSGRFRTYPRLPDWQGLQWSLLLVPGWRQLNGRPLPEIVAKQWAITTSILLDDLEALPAERVRVIDYDSFLQSTQQQIEALSRSLDLPWDRRLDALPPSRMTLTAPDRDKWRRFEAEIEAVWPIVADADARARAFVAALQLPA